MVMVRVVMVMVMTMTVVNINLSQHCFIILCFSLGLISQLHTLNILKGTSTQ